MSIFQNCVIAYAAFIIMLIFAGRKTHLEIAREDESPNKTTVAAHSVQIESIQYCCSSALMIALKVYITSVRKFNVYTLQVRSPVHHIKFCVQEIHLQIQIFFGRYTPNLH